MAKKITTPAEYMAAKASLQRLAQNPAVRTPLALVLDVSGSMKDGPIDQLNAGTKLLLRTILENSRARASVELCVITFDYDVTCIRAFDTISTENDVPEMVTRGGTTHMGEAVQEALDQLMDRKDMYKKAGTDYYQPWMILISDGAPYGEDTAVTESAIARVAELTAQKKLSTYTVGVGDNVDMETLSRFSPQHPPLKLDTLDQFHSLFAWISASVVEIANEKAPENVKPWNLFSTGEAF